jgi:hypothetical protein
MIRGDAISQCVKGSVSPNPALRLTGPFLFHIIQYQVLQGVETFEDSDDCDCDRKTRVGGSGGFQSVVEIDVRDRG